MDNKPIKILHLFSEYLPETENWSYNLINNTPDIEAHIGAINYLKTNFYNPRFHYADNYFDAFNKLNRELGKRKISDLIKKLAIKMIPFLFGTMDQLFTTYAEKNKVQIVHAHFANIGWDFRNIPKKLNTPFVISFYGWDYEKLPHTRPEYQQRFQLLFKMADAFICEGTHGASILKQYGCPKEKIFIVRLGVQPRKIPVIKRRKKVNRLRLVQIASFTEKKGHQYAIKAVAEIIKECPDLELTFIGNDRNPKLRLALENLVQTHNLQNVIKFLPAIDYKKLYETLTDFDVFIHPSCYAEDRDCEGGAPVVLLDAQATGMPVISTKHCDIPDEVIHHQTGLLSLEKDSIALAENIKTFYEMDEEAYQRFAKNARAHIEQEYDCSKNAKKLSEVYQQVLK